MMFSFAAGHTIDFFGPASHFFASENRVVFCIDLFVEKPTKMIILGSKKSDFRSQEAICFRVLVLDLVFERSGVDFGRQNDPKCPPKNGKYT